MNKTIYQILIILSLITNANAQSVYEKVIKTGELRCGYALWPGLVEKDPNSEKLSGAFYEYMEALGNAMEIKIIWAEEVSFGDIVESLRSKRVDAICSGAWTNAVRGKFTEFTTPIAYQSINAYSRADDSRFDGKLELINTANITISVIDGESAATIAATDFPLAKTLSLQKGTDVSQMLLNVATNKADIAFTDAGSAGQFLLKNPGKLKAVKVNYPARVFGLPIVIAKGETELKSSLDAATNQLLWTGKVDSILNKYEKTPGMFVRVRQPYALAN